MRLYGVVLIFRAPLFFVYLKPTTTYHVKSMAAYKEWIAAAVYFCLFHSTHDLHQLKA